MCLDNKGSICSKSSQLTPSGQRQANFARQLHLHPTSLKATIVGREEVERPEDDLLCVFYQFRPDFVVRFQDSAQHSRLYSQPIGSEITVYYLPENPKINGILVH